MEHKHVLKLYDVLETPNKLYMILEHVTGGTEDPFLLLLWCRLRNVCVRVCV